MLYEVITALTDQNFTQMKELSIKDIIDFRGKSDRSKKTFATNLKLETEKNETEGGGDYWVSCLSTISNSYKDNDSSLINA